MLRSLVVATLLALTAPAMAQDNASMDPSPFQGIEALAFKLKGNPGIAADAPSGPPKPKVGIIGSAADGTPAKAVAQGWNAYTMSVCLAGIYGDQQYIAAIVSTGEAMVTTSTYALGIIAANCASGKTFWLYLEGDKQTVTGIASYPR